MNKNSHIYSSLSELSISDRIYKDKASRLLNLVFSLEQETNFGHPNIFMMNRPRGFGLSLLNESVESLFSHDPDMLKKFEDNEYLMQNIPRHHTLSISFRKFNSKNSREFNKNLVDIIQDLYWKHHVQFNHNPYITPKAYFLQLIENLYKRHNEPLIIMISSYDVPLIAANLMADENQKSDAIASYLDVLNVIKHSGSMVKWCLVSGHIKFSLASELSEGLPLVHDLSADSYGDCLFGFTKDEVKDIFKNEIEKICLDNHKDFDEFVDDLEKCYGGFSFSDSLNKVMCPTSVTRAIKNQGNLLAYSSNAEYKFLKKIFSYRDDNLDWLFNKDGQDPLFANSIDSTLKDKQLGSLIIQLGFASRDKVTVNTDLGYTTWRYRFVCPNLDMKRTYYKIRNNNTNPKLEQLDLNESTIFQELEDN